MKNFILKMLLWLVPMGFASVSFGQNSLEQKRDMMLKHANGGVERELINRAYEVLVEGKAQGKWKNVALEELMGYANQESKEALQKMEQEGVTGDAVWLFKSPAGEDLCGYISWSVFQLVTANYLELGYQYNAGFTKLYQDYVVKYNATVWDFTDKIREVEGVERSRELFAQLVDRFDAIFASDPEIHIKVACDIITANYATYGTRAPNAIREYFWLMIQKNLNPDNWLNPVRYDDDIPPTPENGNTDNNAYKRGDFGKQVMLGTFYNDRGMIYWFAVTQDEQEISKIVNIWSSDPARLKKADYQLLKDKGYLQYIEKYPEIYDYVYSRLPN